MKQKFFPFFRDDNGSNLPFFIKKDKKGNDVLVVNGQNSIPLNKKNTDLNYQMAVYNEIVLNKETLGYELKANLYLVLNTKYYEKYSETDLKIIHDNKTVNICSYVQDDNNKVYISNNDYYIVVSTYDCKFPVKDIISIYDIKEKKLVDCTDFATANNIYDSVTKHRRCSYDVIASIITESILIPDKQRLYEFMSFLTGYKIDDGNYFFVAPYVKEYILYKYPEFRDQKISKNINKVYKLNDKYGFDYFTFKPIDYKFENLKYITDEKDVKTKHLCS